MNDIRAEPRANALNDQIAVGDAIRLRGVTLLSAFERAL
jgi:hypothetical protein